MPEPLEHDDTPALLAAFADGELTDDQASRLCDCVSGNPDCVRRVMHEQRLRRACAKVMASETQRCPDEVRRRLDAILQEPAAPSESIREPGRPRPGASGERPGDGPARGRWLPAAVAAVLLLGAVGVYLAAGSDNSGGAGDGSVSGGSGVSGGDAAVLPASHVQRFETRHVRCSVGEAPMMKGELFPATLDGLDPVLAELVDASAAGASLDLSAAGFDYALAGVCPVPGEDAVHLIYTAAEPDEAGPPDRRAALSLWIQHDPSRSDLKPGVPYVAADADHPHPMVVWRERDTVFYLVGDSMQDVERARPLVHLKS